VLASENKQFASLIRGLATLGTVGSQIAQQAGQNYVNDLRDLLPVLNQLESVSQQIGPDFAEISKFEAESTKVAPGAYLQVSAIVNVMLPSGGFEPDVLSAHSSAASGISAALAAARGSSAVADLLARGLS